MPEFSSPQLGSFTITTAEMEDGTTALRVRFTEKILKVPLQASQGKAMAEIDEDERHYVIKAYLTNRGLDPEVGTGIDISRYPSWTDKSGKDHPFGEGHTFYLPLAPSDAEIDRVGRYLESLSAQGLANRKFEFRTAVTPSAPVVGEDNQLMLGVYDAEKNAQHGENIRLFHPGDKLPKEVASTLAGLGMSLSYSNKDKGAVTLMREAARTYMDVESSLADKAEALNTLKTQITSCSANNYSQLVGYLKTHKSLGNELREAFEAAAQDDASDTRWMEIVQTTQSHAQNLAAFERQQGASR